MAPFPTIMPNLWKKVNYNLAVTSGNEACHIAAKDPTRKCLLATFHHHDLSKNISWTGPKAPNPKAAITQGITSVRMASNQGRHNSH